MRHLAKSLFKVRYNLPLLQLMIQLLFTAIFLWVGCTFLTAQNTHQGFIITNQNDTIYGTIIYGDAAQQNVEVTFVDPATQKSKVFKPYQLKAYFANSEFHESKIYDESQGLGYGHSVFMKRLNDGQVKVYEYWNNTTARPFTQLFITNGKDRMVFVSQLKFKKQMATFFKDSAFIQKKILDGDYNRKDVLQLAVDYNNWKKGEDGDGLTQN